MPAAPVSHAFGGGWPPGKNSRCQAGEPGVGGGHADRDLGWGQEREGEGNLGRWDHQGALQAARVPHRITSARSPLSQERKGRKGANPQALKLMRPPPVHPTRALRVLAESRTHRKEAEDTRPRTVSTPQRRAGSRGVAEARLGRPLQRPGARSPPRSPGPAPRPSKEGAHGRARVAATRSRISGRLERSLAGAGRSRPRRRPPAPPHPRSPAKFRLLGPDHDAHSWEEVKGGSGSPAPRLPPGAYSARLGYPPGGAGNAGATRGRPPCPPRRGPGRRGRDRRVLPNPGTKVLRKRQMTATGKGM